MRHGQALQGRIALTRANPEGCIGNDVASVSRIAAAGVANSPQIPTYVIGVGGVQGLDAIARAGGTNQGFIVDDTNARQQVLDALIQIAGRLTTCEFTLPRDGREIDYGKVNVRHTPIGGSESMIYFVDGPADCSVATGGWYYVSDASGNPASIKLCPTSCDAAKLGGRVDIAFGCPTLRHPLQ